MSEIRQRIVDDKPVNGQEPIKSADTDEDGTDAENVTDPNAGASLPQDTGKTTEALDSKLEALPPRWRNWVVRGIFSWVMIFGFSFIIWLGPLALVFLVFLIQIKCFNEIITIGYAVYKSHDLPWFRTLSWYLLISSNYFFYGESMIHYFGLLLSRAEFASPFVTFHRFISFSLYIGGFVGFVCSLRKKYYLKQFTLFGYTHVTLLLIVAQSHLIIQNIFEGLIWFLVPVSIIICNDIMAYMFGFFFGKTPLIKLSPKKTWEGFVGGAFSTVIYGIIISQILVQYDFFVCPINYDEQTESLSMTCQRSIEFLPASYSLPNFIAKTGGLFRKDWSTVTMVPFVLHSISLSLFASVLGPFGGFFASGFKRAFKIKDFGDTIPGHGGLMDRFDCQLLMATFVHVYHSSFIKVLSPQRMLTQIMTLPANDQVNIFNVLQESLIKRGLLS